MRTIWGYECLFCHYCWFDAFEGMEEKKSPADYMDDEIRKKMQMFYRISKRVAFVASTQEEWAEEKQRRKLAKRQ